MNADMTNIFINNKPVFVDELPSFIDDNNEQYKVFKIDKSSYNVHIIDGFDKRAEFTIPSIDKLLFDYNEEKLYFENGNKDNLISISCLHKIVIINFCFSAMWITMIEEPAAYYSKPFVIFNRQYGESDFRHFDDEYISRNYLNHRAFFNDLYIYIKNHVPVYIRSERNKIKLLSPEDIDKIVKFVEAYESGKIESIEYNGKPHDLKSVDFIYGKINIDIGGKEFKSIPIENVITGEMAAIYNDEE